MEWMRIIGDSIQYIEEHLQENVRTEDVAQYVHLSSFYLQKGFAMLCGMTIGEYIRNRKLAKAGQELIETDQSVLEIALKYGYESPDSFTKAFTRFHSTTPNAVRKGAMLRSFAPFHIHFTLTGGKPMEYRIEKKEAFTVIANCRTFDNENSMRKIPMFWDEHIAEGKCAVVKGVYGICIETDNTADTFEYLIADPYVEGMEVPEGFIITTIPALEWAIFPCVGPLPDTLQKTTMRIYQEWLPTMKEYEISAGYGVELYSDVTEFENGTKDETYYSEVWLPIRKRM